MRLYCTNDRVDSYNNRQLQRLVQQGVPKLRLVAGHGQIGDSGQVRRERIDVAQMPRDKDNCGGLADIIEVSTQQHCAMTVLHAKCSLHMERYLSDVTAVQAWQYWTGILALSY